jgi:hypothetical protein
MNEQPDHEIVGRIMDKAATANRRALFAALQAAITQITDARFGGFRSNPYLVVEEALDVGAEYGSPEQLAHAKAKWAALRDPGSTEEGEHP